MSGLKTIPKIISNYIKKRDTYQNPEKQEWYWKCRLCNKPAEHIHHIDGRISMKHGQPDIIGGNHEYNLISLCSECHAKIHQYGFSDNLKNILIQTNKNKRIEYKELTEYYKKNKSKLYKGEL